MVDYNAATCRFGQPPEPGKEMHYPGVPARLFTALAAVEVYGQVMKKEREMRWPQLMLGGKYQETGFRDPEEQFGKGIGDLLPGYRSIDRTYERIGYKKHPKTGLPVPPKIQYDLATPMSTPTIRSYVSSTRPDLPKICGPGFNPPFPPPGIQPRRARSTSALATRAPRALSRSASQLSATCPWLSKAEGGSTSRGSASRLSAKQPCDALSSLSAAAPRSTVSACAPSQAPSLEPAASSLLSTAAPYNAPAARVPFAEERHLESLIKRKCGRDKGLHFC